MFHAHAYSIVLIHMHVDQTVYNFGDINFVQCENVLFAIYLNNQ